MIDWLRAFARNLPRPVKRAVLIIFDAAAMLAVLWLAFYLRLGDAFVLDPIGVVRICLAPLVAIPIFVRMGLYRAVVRYMPERAIVTITQAMLLATVAWVTAVFLSELYGHSVFPRSVPVFFFFVGTVVVAASRLAIKGFMRVPDPGRVGRQTLIYGANNAGIELASALGANGVRRIAGFLDDDRRLQGNDVMGLRVYAPSELETLVENYGVREVVLPFHAGPQARRQQVYQRLHQLGVRVSTVPAISDLASGKFAVRALRDIDIGDLIGRSSVPANPDLLRAMIEGRSIMVTGAGGSIGSELARLIVRWKPARLVLFEANEYALYQIDRRLRLESDAAIVPILGTVEDSRQVLRVLRAQGVELVIHAAAHKHVPLLEHNVLEGVRNNVLGTHAVANAALEAGVGKFVLISTDKAVWPTSVMGATKRWAELIVRDCANRASADQQFCAVRFGNVLGSNGSVVPLFQEQIDNGGPVTLTDENMTRYFMSIHEAAELIVQAGALSKGGDTFLLDMGEPIYIRELAENMIKLAGLTVKSGENGPGDIEIKVIGARPGEKLTEELFYDPANATPTQQPKILMAHSPDTGFDAARQISRLRDALATEDDIKIRTVLFDALKEQSLGMRQDIGRNRHQAQ